MTTADGAPTARTQSDGAPTARTQTAPLLGLAGLVDLTEEVVGFCGPAGCAPEPEGTDRDD